MRQGCFPKILIFIASFSVSGLCQQADLTGTVTSTSGGPVPNATVNLVGYNLSDITDAEGKYALSGQLVGVVSAGTRQSLLRLSSGKLIIRLGAAENLKIEFFDLSGRKLAGPVNGLLEKGEHVFSVNKAFSSTALNILRLTRNNQVSSYKIFGSSSFQIKFLSGFLAKGAENYTLEASAAGYAAMQKPITSLTGVYDFVLVPQAASAELYYDATDSAISFSARHLGKVLENKGTAASLRPLTALTAIPTGNYIVLAKTSSVTSLYVASAGAPVAGGQGEQDYAYRVTGAGDARGYWILGGGRRGAMYGGIHMAEIVAAGSLSDVTNTEKKPYILNRGVKLNLNIDQRTPTFDAGGDVFKYTQDDFYDLAFWSELFDLSAIQSYNNFTFWNRHPFPSLVHVEDYPNVTLNGVEGWNGTIKDWDKNRRIEHWNQVYELAYNRGIEILWVVWNVELQGAEGVDGISRDKNDPEAIDYLRKATEQMFISYPRLNGIGICAGEKMENYSDAEKEQYVWNSYGKGVLDAKKRFPDRYIRFIHRFWLTDAAEVENLFRDLPDGYEFSVKYNQARLYSVTRPSYAFNQISRDGGIPTTRAGWWILRQDDIFHQRWGDPDFVKDMILGFPHESKSCTESPCLTAGYTIGSDRYLWGRECMSKNPREPLRQLEMDKHYYAFLLWGRLGFDPNTSYDLFKGLLKYRYPSSDAVTLFNAMQSASKLIPMISRFHYRPWDYMYYIEMQIANEWDQVWEGFHDIRKIIDLSDPNIDAGYQNIRDFVDGKGTGVTPLVIADSLEQNANTALALAATLSDNGNNDLRETIGDIKSQAHFGLYWAHRIRGGVSLKKYWNDNNSQDQTDAINHLTKAADEFKKYAGQLYVSYNKTRISGFGLFDLDPIIQDVEGDIAIARN